MRFPRSSGILLHPTSLPSQFGIGDIGKEAYRFIDFLSDAGQKLWQILPLGPTGYGNSPYACFSAFAGNPLLISFEELLHQGLLQHSDLTDIPDFPKNEVDYKAVINFKYPLLQKSFDYFKNNFSHEIKYEFNTFCEQNISWLDDYALFMSLKSAYKEKVWNKWDKEISQRQPEAIEKAAQKYADSILFYKYLQYQFFKQWSFLKKYANEKNISIIGDIPIFIAYNSADVWSHPSMFYLDKNGNPTVVAGVPPDYFSSTGQLWGNPLYRWDIMAYNKYNWWINRFNISLELVDILRIDHFRGFEAYWEIPAHEKTAIHGRWVKGPGADLFYAIEKTLGKLPLIAEDLGVITPEVEALRDQFNFPGMKILHFAFGSDADNQYLPHNFPRNCVIYSGTHDNDTTIGWFSNSSSSQEKEYALAYLDKIDGSEIHWDLIRLSLSSVADMAIFPLQDLIGLGSKARMNLPGKALGNWKWRFTLQMLNDTYKNKLKEMTLLYGR
ncbi:MAG: 4-alpha-glucanotransferase [bacterium]|nr:4-alpha-glucanotransferase [bacterium]